MMKLLRWLLVGGVAACADPSGTTCRLVKVTELPFTIEDGSLVVDAMIAGGPVKLAFDTGSSTSVLTLAAVRRLKLGTIDPEAGQIEGLGGVRRANMVAAASFTLGDLHGQDFAFLSSDVFGDDDRLDGLLSTDFLAKYDIDLDFPDRKIILYYPLGSCAAQPNAGLLPPLYSVPLTVKQAVYDTGAPQDTADKTPNVAVSINGHRMLATIDTGAQNSAIFRAAAAREGLPIGDLPQSDFTTLHGVGPDSVRTVRRAFAPITIGDITISHLPVDILDQFRVGNEDMLLGLDFMSRVHVWISYSSNTLIMEVPPQPSPVAH